MSKNTGSVFFDDASVVGRHRCLSGSLRVPATSGVGPTFLNAGFEQGPMVCPGWAPTGPSTGTLSWASGTDHSGSYSVEISGSGTQAAWTEVINTELPADRRAARGHGWAEHGRHRLQHHRRGLAPDQRDHISNNVLAPLPDGTWTWTELSMAATMTAPHKVTTGGGVDVSVIDLRRWHLFNDHHVSSTMMMAHTWSSCGVTTIWCCGFFFLAVVAGEGGVTMTSAGCGRQRI